MFITIETETETYLVLIKLLRANLKCSVPQHKQHLAVYPNINSISHEKLFLKQLNSESRITLFYIFANLFNVWLNKRQLGFRPPSAFNLLQCITLVKRHKEMWPHTDRVVPRYLQETGPRAPTAIRQTQGPYADGTACTRPLRCFTSPLDYL